MLARIANISLGVWLMAAPAVLGYADPAETNDRIVGPLVATTAIIAIWEVTRPLRWVNLLLGVWLLVAPWVLDYERIAVTNSILVGVFIAGFALVGGAVKARVGGGWSSLWTSEPRNEPERRE
jgi:hypothetical protein